MDRRKYYLNQLVDDDDLNAGETNTYNAIGNMMSDIGIFGIISGGAVTEQGVPSMSVDMSTPFIGYDQDGERIYKATGDVIDCSVDYLGNPTVPSVGGESVWISIHGRFTYTEEDPKVIAGSTEYLTWAESYEWRVVAGTPAVSPGHAKPAKPADAILICDIELINGQTTILNADIDETRKDTFVFAPASATSVVGSGFTKLATTIDDVQEALDAIDVMLIDRDGAGEVQQSILPAGGEHLGGAANFWGNLYADSILNQGLGTETVGTPAAPYNEGHFNTAIVRTKLEAFADGKPIGDATNRFAAHFSSVLLYGTIADRLKFSAAKSVTVMIPVTEWLNLSGTDWAWDAAKNSIDCGVAARSALIYFKLPHGVTLQSMRIRWAQVSGTGMTARVYSLDEDNTETAQGAAKTITTTTGSLNWDTIASAMAHTVDRGTTHHRVKVTTITNTSHQVAMLEATFDVTDILKGALYNCS